MVNLPTVDIIIPNYNKGKYLEECLNSVISQSYKKWNVYLIDDNSSDNSKEIIKKFRSYKNINTILLDNNLGPAYCRNLGIKNSKSEYIAFLDSDDYWPQNKLEKQLHSMKNNNYHFTYTDLKFFLNDMIDEMRFVHLPKSYIYNRFILNSTMSTSSIIIKKEALGDTCFKNVKHEDYLFKCDLLKKEILAFNVEGTFTYYRINKKNRSSNKLSNIFNLWSINSNYNNLNFFKNLESIIKISINSLKTYGWK